MSVRVGRVVVSGCSLEQVSVLLDKHAFQSAGYCNTEDAVPRMAKLVLQRLEEASGRCHQGLGQALAAERRRFRMEDKSALRSVRALHEANGFYRHITEIGEAAWMAKVLGAIDRLQPRVARGDCDDSFLSEIRVGDVDTSVGDASCIGDSASEARETEPRSCLELEPDGLGVWFAESVLPALDEFAKPMVACKELAGTKEFTEDLTELGARTPSIYGDADLCGWQGFSDAELEGAGFALGTR